MNQPLPPRVLQLIGLAIIVGSLVYSFVTGRQVVEFLGAATTLVALGSVMNASERVTMRERANEYEVPRVEHPKARKHPASGPGGKRSSRSDS